ncbi:MAG: hypothetical protein AXW14_11290 [Alteromonas sp. Nap_26]|nr:MAG: hypothetical protein AXW14_11290 [Alteromonas sp. Nap_26]
MKYRLTAFAIFFLTYACSAAEIELFTESFPPYNFVQEDKIVGINTDLLSLACKQANIDCSFSLYPWKRAMDSVKRQPNSGLYSTARINEREDNFIWVGPIVSSYSCFYKLTTRRDIAADDYNALKNYTVGIPRSDIYENILQRIGLNEANNYLTFSKKHEDMSMFEQGKLDLIIGSSLTLSSQLTQVNLKPKDIEPVIQLKDIALVANYLALNKNTNPELVSKLQHALDQIKANGLIESIVSKYVPVNKDSNTSSTAQTKRCVDGAAKY